MPHASLARTAGTSAIAGGVLLLVSVAAELLHPVQTRDGTTVEPVLHAIYVVVWIAGWTLIVAAVVGLRSLLRASGAGPRRTSIGAWLSIAGAAALGMSGIGTLVGIAAGADLEVFFLFFLIAFPLLVPGQILLGLGMRSSAVMGLGWVLPIIAAVGLLVAFAVDVDPFHDVGFFVFDAAWIGLGLMLVNTARVAPAAGSG